jgi:hypothetical protein
MAEPASRMVEGISLMAGRVSRVADCPSHVDKSVSRKGVGFNRVAGGISHTSK